GGNVAAKALKGWWDWSFADPGRKVLEHDQAVLEAIQKYEFWEVTRGERGEQTLRDFYEMARHNPKMLAAANFYVAPLVGAEVGEAGMSIARNNGLDVP